MFDERSFGDFERIGVWSFLADVNLDFLCGGCEGSGQGLLDVSCWEARSWYVLCEAFHLCWLYCLVHDRWYFVLG